jgi:hypothetical protein
MIVSFCMVQASFDCRCVKPRGQGAVCRGRGTFGHAPNLTVVRNTGGVEKKKSRRARAPWATPAKGTNAINYPRAAIARRRDPKRKAGRPAGRKGDETKEQN